MHLLILQILHFAVKQIKSFTGFRVGERPLEELPNLYSCTKRRFVKCRVYMEFGDDLCCTEITWTSELWCHMNLLIISLLMSANIKWIYFILSTNEVCDKNFLYTLRKILCYQNDSISKYNINEYVRHKYEH